MRVTSRHKLVMGIFPNTKGFAFALFEGSLAPVDWAITRIRSGEKNRDSVARIARLFGHYQPDVVVLQDMSIDGTRRSARITQLNETIAVLAESQNIAIAKFTREHVRKAFSNQGIITRHAMAETIAAQIPMLRRFVPPQRKIWETEDARLAPFEAVGLIVAFYKSAANEA